MENYYLLSLIRTRDSHTSIIWDNSPRGNKEIIIRTWCNMGKLFCQVCFGLVLLVMALCCHGIVLS